MNRLTQLGAALVLVATNAIAQEKPTTGQIKSIVKRHGQLRVAGNRIVDQNGKPVALRGMSLFWSQWAGQFYNAEAVKWLRDDWECTVVRAAIAVEHGGYLKNPEREKKKVFAVVQAAIDLGIYVIVDWHDHNAHQHQNEAQTFFAELAEKYGEHPNLIYETWNEPLDKHDWASVIKPYHEALIPIIRKHDPDSLIVCGTQTWSQDVDKAARDPLKFSNVAYTLHFYAASHKGALRKKAAAALESGAALMVTEWGTSESSGSGKLDQEETQKWSAFMDKHDLSWCNWSVVDKRETCAALKPGASNRGRWREENVSPSGTLVRAAFRKSRRQRFP